MVRAFSFGRLQATLPAPEQKVVKPLRFMKLLRGHQRLVHLVALGVRDNLTDLEQLEEVRFTPSALW